MRKKTPPPRKMKCVLSQVGTKPTGGVQVRRGKELRAVNRPPDDGSTTRMKNTMTELGSRRPFKKKGVRSFEVGRGVGQTGDSVFFGLHLPSPPRACPSVRPPARSTDPAQVRPFSVAAQGKTPFAMRGEDTSGPRRGGRSEAGATLPWSL